MKLTENKKEYQHNYYLLHIEYLKEKAKLYNIANRDKISEHKRHYYLNKKNITKNQQTHTETV